MKQLVIYFCLCTQLFVYCMQEIAVKLKKDDSCLALPLNVIQKSKRMYDKQLWKEKLKIPEKKPIVVHDISSEKLNLFINAAQKTEKTFPAFFTQLTIKERRKLISVAGEDALDAPEITALLAQSYLLNDIVQKHIIPYMDALEVIHYMQQGMIKHNIPQSDIDWSVFFQKDKTMLCSNGIYYEIPDDFDAHETLYTTNIFELLKPIDLNNPTDIIHMKKQVNSCEYRVTSTIGDNGLVGHMWRIKNEVVEKKEFLLKNHIRTTICSQDGNYIVICTEPDNQNALFIVDHSSDVIVEKQLCLTKNLRRLIDVQFNHSSTVLFVLSCDEDTCESQLLIYDFKNNQEKLLHFNNWCFIAPAINHDSTCMILSHVGCNEADTLSVWDICSVQNPFQLASFNITQLGCDVAKEYNTKYKINFRDSVYVCTVHYTHGSNNAFAQLHNGNMLFIDEITPNQINITTSINPVIYPFPKNIRNVCLLCTPDDNFIISYGGVYENNLLGYQNKESPTVTIWDMQTKKMISAHQRLKISASKDPTIIMSCDACSFILNVASGHWLDYTLYSSNENATCTWIKENKNLFSCYVLQRLYKAHKEQEEIIVYENDAIDTFLKTLPKNIQQCIKNYLIIESKKGILETIKSFFTSYSL